MSILNKTISFLAVFSVLPSAYGLTARPSIKGQASTRMPTMTVSSYTSSISTTTSSSSSSSSLLDNIECIDAYTSCMKGGDACGSDFEECTTKVLFHGKMPQCLSTLAQCSTSGINSLFGVGTTTSLNTVATKNSFGEVTDYTYPTDGSILGQLITGAAISHKYDTSTCVKRYTSCLKKDSVCGSDFELCTTDKEFRKQRVYCDSTLARCQSDGIIELFGSNSTSATPSATSRVGELIAEGASLAAVNAVSTCYKVVDQCILGACTSNPYRCNENSVKTVASLVDSINNGTDVIDNDTIGVSDTITKSEISGYIKNSCLDTIGANKYCYATFIGNGQMPTASQLKDADNQEEIFDEAYSARMGSGMRAKITDLLNAFDTKAKAKCVDTIRACAMRTCGSGSGAACYSQVFGATDKSINNEYTREEIKIGCESIVNTDANCKYAAANPNSSGNYSYTYINNNAFDTLFPEYSSVGTNNDPIGVIGSLNASLANNYSDAALAQMRKQCQAIATSCVRSMCGTDFVSCYRKRTDVYSTLTNTGDDSYDKSMNKVDGVLDYTVVLGMCLDTVKNASVCEEHLAIEQNKLKIAGNQNQSVWGTDSVRGDWIDAGSATKIAANTDSIQDVDENGQSLCTTRGGIDQGVCYTVDASGAIYDQPVMISYTSYYQSQAANSLFKDLIYDLQTEAQAKYKSKLIKEQSTCFAQNNGGIMGKNDLGGTYMWVKLKSNKIPKTYQTAGLKANQFVASNDLYGSFCRARITLMSDDKTIQDVLNKGVDWSTAYFATGDYVTCGSWIPNSALESMADAVAKAKNAEHSSAYSRTRNWLTALGAIGGAVGGGYMANSIANGNALSGLTGIEKKQEVNVDDVKKVCKSTVETAKSRCNEVKMSTDQGTVSDPWSTCRTWASAVATQAKKIKDNEAYVKALESVNPPKANYNSKTQKYEYTAEDVNRRDEFVKSYENALGDIETFCSISEEADKGKNKQWISSAIGAVVGGVGGGILLNKMVDDIQDSKLEAEYRTAYNEWMNDVGNHITCYVGGDEAGRYGDVFQIEIQ